MRSRTTISRRASSLAVAAGRSCSLLVSCSIVLAACGDDAADDATAVCGPGDELPDWAPVDGAAVVVSHAHGVPDGTELWLDGAQDFRGPFPCVVVVPPGDYTARYVAGGAELASLDVALAARDVRVIGMLLHPTLAPEVIAVPWDFTPPADDAWRLQLANFAPESADASLAIHAFPPGTPSNPVPPDAVATLLGAIPRGEQLTALVPHDTQILAFVPEGSPVPPHQASTSLLRDPCAAQMGFVMQVWCDTADPDDDAGGPCQGVLGAHLWAHSLDGVGCELRGRAPR